ncbi:methionine/alanine import family NSS transporter small subunit [Heyndrickxia acidiproducens]|nr:methionine/alanine import family NSS transporter small subunit [Heyndrickxia acidiproducens]
MSATAITVMIIGMVIIWGGLAASVLHAIKK